MQERHLFEYAVIRVVPRVEREEFINAGIILYCAKKHFLQALFIVDAQRMTALCPATDAAEIGAHLAAFQNICNGNPAGGPIGKLDAASRFRWLTATRSTVVQSSKVHPGFCKDPAETLTRLYNELVLLH